MLEGYKMNIDTIQKVLGEGVDFFVDKDKNVVVDGKIIKISKADINNTDNEIKSGVVSVSLMQLVDLKQEDAYKSILGYKSTPKQIERYRDKYDRAVEGEFTNDVNKVIISKFEKMRTAIRNFTDLIEYFRGKVDDLIQSDKLDKAEQAIEAGRSFNSTTTIVDVEQLINNL